MTEKQLEVDLAQLTLAVGELSAAIVRAEEKWREIATRQMELEQSFLQLTPIVAVAKQQLLGKPHSVPGSVPSPEDGDSDDDEAEETHAGGE